MTFSNLNDGLIYKVLGVRWGAMVFCILCNIAAVMLISTSLGPWNWFTLKYIHTKPLRLIERYMLGCQAKVVHWERKFPHSFFCSHSSCSYPLGMVTKTHSEDAIPRSSSSAIGSALWHHGLPLSYLQYHMWAATMSQSWPICSVWSVSEQGRMARLCRSCAKHRQSHQGERLCVSCGGWDMVGAQGSAVCLPGNLPRRTPFHWRNKRLFLSASDLRKKKKTQAEGKGQ